MKNLLGKRERRGGVKKKTRKRREKRLRERTRREAKKKKNSDKLREKTNHNNQEKKRKRKEKETQRERRKEERKERKKKEMNKTYYSFRGINGERTSPTRGNGGAGSHNKSVLLVPNSFENMSKIWREKVRKEA